MSENALILRAILGLESRERREFFSEQAQEQGKSSFPATQTVKGKVVVVLQSPNAFSYR